MNLETNEDCFISSQLCRLRRYFNYSLLLAGKESTSSVLDYLPSPKVSIFVCVGLRTLILPQLVYITRECQLFRGTTALIPKAKLLSDCESGWH